MALRLEKRYKQLRGQVQYQARVELTFERITGNLKGSIVGWKLTPEQAATKVPKTLPGLENLWMVGHWVYPGGGVPAEVATAREVIWRQCKKDKKRFTTLAN